MALHPDFASFRLLAPLPLTILFRRVVYRVTTHQIPGGSCSWVAVAENPQVGHWRLCYGFETESQLHHAVYHAGFEARGVPVWILFQLTREGRAEEVRQLRQAV